MRPDSVVRAPALRRATLLAAGATAFVLATGLLRAVSLAWTCDDAWISFRYAKNFVSGTGLVFNPGERVEGYTNFLWVLMNAPAFPLAIPPETWANVMSLASFAGIVLLLARRAWVRAGETGGPLFPVPVAAAVVALNPDLQVWATGGLETAFFSFLLVAGVFLLSGPGGSRLRELAAGATFGLAALTRPDGLLPAAVALAWLLFFRPGRRLAASLAFAAGAAALVVPHLLWRHAYYGGWLPNTYYAKSAWRAWWGQGLLYLGLFLRRNVVLLLGFPLVVLVGLQSRRRPGMKGTLDRLVPEAVLVSGIAVSYGLFVTRVGGDFMYARLLIPAVPLLGILLELAVSTPALPAAFRAGPAAAALLFPFLVASPVPPGEFVDGVADERAAYTGDGVRLADQVGSTLELLFAGLPVRVLAGGAEMRVAYRSGAAEVIEAHGLTDRRIARQPLAKRGRVGHERFADLDYVLRERYVHFMFHPPAADYPGIADVIPSITATHGPAVLWVMSWDPPLMEELARRGARFPSFPETLDRYVAVMHTLSDETVRRDYVRCRNFYFDRVADPVREAPFKRRLGLP